MTQAELARRFNKQHSTTVTKRELGDTKIRPREYALWDRALRLPAGSFEAEVGRQQAILDEQERQQAATSDDDPNVREMLVLNAVLGELGPIVLDICKHTRGEKRERMISNIVRYAEGVAEASKSPDPSAPIVGTPRRAVLLGPPAKDIHGARRAYFESEGGVDDADEKEDRRSAGG